FITLNAQPGSGPGAAGVRFSFAFLGNNIDVHDNAISGNGTAGGVNNQSTTPVNFSRNYWGAANGPGSGSNGPGSGNAPSANVDRTPFVVSGTDSAPATPGFQPDFSALTVTALNVQTVTTNGRVQEGVTDLAPGGTLNVLNGTYLEQNVALDKAMTVDGQS